MELSKHEAVATDNIRGRIGGIPRIWQLGREHHASSAVHRLTKLPFCSATPRGF